MTDYLKAHCSSSTMDIMEYLDNNKLKNPKERKNISETIYDIINKSAEGAFLSLTNRVGELESDINIMKVEHKIAIESINSKMEIMENKYKKREKQLNDEIELKDTILKSYEIACRLDQNMVRLILNSSEDKHFNQIVYNKINLLPEEKERYHKLFPGDKGKSEAIEICRLINFFKGDRNYMFHDKYMLPPGTETNEIKSILNQRSPNLIKEWNDKRKRDIEKQKKKSNGEYKENGKPWVPKENNIPNYINSMIVYINTFCDGMLFGEEEFIEDVEDEEN